MVIELNSQGRLTITEFSEYTFPVIRQRASIFTRESKAMN